MGESMTYMSAQARLRLDAETRLEQGFAPPTENWTLSIKALTALYKLASTPDSAGEGLKLLHELQTHQVELNLQHEQLVANEREFAQELVRYKAFFDFAPAGYLIVSRNGRIIESNLAGARLFGVDADELGGRMIHSLVLDSSRIALAGLLDTLCTQGAAASCKVFVAAVPASGSVCHSDNSSGGNHDSGVRRLRITASVPPDSDTFLMLVSEYD